MKKAIYILLSVILFSCGEGEPGPQGFSALINTRRLYLGDVNCPNGGTQIDTGIDNGDGDGIAGNESLETGEIDDSSFTCNGGHGNEGPIGKDDPVNSFYFDRIFNDIGAIIGYDDLGFSNINNHDPNSTNDPNSINRHLLKLIVDNTGDYTIQKVLIKFDSISEVIIPEVGNDFLLNMAILYIFVQNGNFTNLDFTYIGANAIFNRFRGNPVPVYDQTTVSWNNANAGQLWQFPGVYPSNIIIADDKVRIENDAKLNFSPRWVSFILDRNEVSRWITSTAENRGILLSILERDGFDDFNNARVEFRLARPILFIDAQETPSGGRIREKTDSEYRNRWESMSEEERLAPLKEYLSRN